MVSTMVRRLGLPALLLWLVFALPAQAQQSNIRLQCPEDVNGDGKVTYGSGDVDAAPTGNFPGPEDTDFNHNGILEVDADLPGVVCEHVSAGDGNVTMADGKFQYTFGFSRLPLQPEAGFDPSDPNHVMDRGRLAANFPGPTLVADEDDQVFLTLTNVGMTMRPDLFDPHTVHWHGFRNAASIFDGVPDGSISISQGASLTYYYQPKDAGTYMWHCHVEATEHMQMGMLANLYVRPRQNRLAPATFPNGFVHQTGNKYVYNDGDGSTRYDVEYPIQIGSFDPDFHDASFGVQPLPFAGMRDRYFMLNGRGYPDTVNPAELSTLDPTGREQFSQKVTSLITANPGQRILLRISNLNVTMFNTLATLGIPMRVVGLDAQLLRDDAGNDMSYLTNSITIGGGQSADVILEATNAGTYFLYTTNLHQLSNDRENFGGQMTEIRIAN